MAADNYPQDPGSDLNLNPDGKMNLKATKAASDFGLFPYPEHLNRINYYTYYEKLFIGDHFGAFSIVVDDERFNRSWGRLRYVMANFAGLVSKVIADFLFSEPITIKVPDGDQDFMDALVRENKLDMQFYESALTNSYMGDDLFKVRAGLRRPGDTVSSVIIEEVTPAIYFPQIDGFNVREEPEVKELAWTFELNGDKYLRKEIHTPGLIRNEIWLMNKNKIVAEVPSLLAVLNLQPEQLTGIDRHLITHTVNWKTGNRHFGISDYHDLDALFYAINNRLTKTDNILDKHSDPILAVPPGVIDEKGNVRKKALGVVEVGDGEDGKPEYIVWDASLDSAFKQLEKEIDALLMTAEISPDAFGMGKGQSDSGRALKYKLLRTIAKAARKRIYYDAAIKEMLFTAQVLAKTWGLQAGGLKLKGDPAEVEIRWNDGIPVDELEQIEIESQKIDAGVQSKKAAIMEIDQIDDASAEEKLKEIEDEKPKIELPSMNLGKNAGNMNGEMPPKNMPPKQMPMNG